MSQRHEQPGLPPVTDEVLDRVEDSVFTRIDTERRDRERRARTRSRRTVGWVSAAAAIAVLGALAVPALIGTVGSSSSAGSSSVDEAPAQRALSDQAAPGAPEAADAGAADGAAMTADGGVAPAVITMADASLTVADVHRSASALSSLARELGGSVQDQSLGFGDTVEPRGASSADYGHVTLRIPADSLDDAITRLDTIGEVTSSAMNVSDVTATRIDLRARVASLTTSVSRLEEIMAKTASVADLVAAESALSERQATLESYQQQLDALDEQVAMSTLSVSLTADAPVHADSAGFGDGITQGWRTLVVTLNAFVVAAGFLLPWLALAAVALALIWIVIRTVRARRVSHSPDDRA